MKQAYHFPAFGTPAHGGADGAGSTIGIVMSSPPNPSDLARYFGHEKLPVPSVRVEPVAGGSTFSATSDASFEADLDVQQSGAMAPDANIVVYAIPDLSDPSVFAAYTQVVEDDSVDVVSGSFGGCELDYTAAYNGGTDYTGVLRALNDLFVQADAQGITTVFSSGDFGAPSCPSPQYFEHPNAHSTTPFVLGVSYPADSPNVVAVGGARPDAHKTPGSRFRSYSRRYRNRNRTIA